MNSRHMLAPLRAVSLVLALLFALRPAAAQEPAPGSETADGSAAYFGLSHGEASALALAVGELVIDTAAVTAYYGPGAGAAIAGLFAAHMFVDLMLVGAGTGGVYALWGWDAEPPPQVPDPISAPRVGDTF